MKSTVIIATVLVTAFVTASAIPALAAPNDGRFQQSIEANAGGSCTTYLDYYEDALKRLNTAKTKAARAEARADANWAIERAFSGGCSWLDGV
jgi:hypothetical protein